MIDDSEKPDGIARGPAGASSDRLDVAQLPQVFQSFQAPLCLICHDPLSIHEQAVGETCSKPACKTRLLRESLQQQAEREQELRQKAWECFRTLTPPLSECPSGPSVVGVLPANDRKLVPVAQRRVRRFRDRLMRIISEAAAIRYGSGQSEGRSSGSLADSWAESPAESPSPQTQALLGNACATCRGHCCFQGGEHGFIQVETILCHMGRHPQQRPRDVLQHYLSYLGEKTYDQSCVYHAEDGCRLPREMRSAICNDFLCKGIQQVWFRLPESTDPRAFVVATQGQSIVRAALIQSDQTEVREVSGELDSPLPD